MSKGSKESNKDEDDSTVLLGYIEDDDKIDKELILLEHATEGLKLASTSSSGDKKNDIDEQIPPWLVNKIGGLPIFPTYGLNIDELEKCLESMKCKACKNDCVLIFQMSCPVDDSPLDRVMQVYTCVKKDCSKHTWFALRCMFKNNPVQDNFEPKVELKQLELVKDAIHGHVLVCRNRAFFDAYYVSVLEEPTGREDFLKNNLEAMKLASKYNDPDLKPAPIEAKYKNLKNYKAPQPPAHLSDLEDFEKFQLEKLYGNDKDMYRYYKRLARYQAQVVRYDWEGKPMINSGKIKLNILPCSSCSRKRNFEFQLMSALINYLKTDQEFDKESIDFSSIIVHSCSSNCTQKSFTLEDTYFVPDPDSRIFNKVKQRMLAVKLKD